MSSWNARSYRSEFQSNSAPSSMINGSIPTIVPRTISETEDEEYNPFEHRNLTHPTTDRETLIHLLKGSMGIGLLAMPYAFAHAGLWFGLIGTSTIGIVCTYCIHILVKCSHILCRRAKLPSLGFADVAEVAFSAGPRGLRKFASLSKAAVNWFLIIELLGCCSVYVGFFANNIKPVLDNYLPDMDIRAYMLFLLPALIPMNLIKNLKYLAPFSMIANLLIGSGMVIILYYVFSTLDEAEVVPKFAGIQTLPIFFGTAIFSLEGIGVVMPLENNMQTPAHFIGCPGILHFAMGFIVSLYTTVGFVGYLRYGHSTAESISANLPNDPLAQSVKVMIATAIFFTFCLQFYVPMEIIWKSLKHRFTYRPKLAENVLRIFLVTLCVTIAILVPNLGPMISLVGAVCLSFLGLMFPSIIELVVFYDEGYGFLNWMLWKNLAVIAFGVLGLATGTMVSLQELFKEG